MRRGEGCIGTTTLHVLAQVIELFRTEGPEVSARLLDHEVGPEQRRA